MANKNAVDLVSLQGYNKVSYSISFSEEKSPSFKVVPVKSWMEKIARNEIPRIDPTHGCTYFPHVHPATQKVFEVVVKFCKDSRSC